MAGDLNRRVDIIINTIFKTTNAKQSKAQLEAITKNLEDANKKGVVLADQKQVSAMRKLVGYSQRFRMEFLGIMFAGMALAKQFDSIVAAAKETQKQFKAHDKVMGKMVDKSIIMQTYIDMLKEAENYPILGEVISSLSLLGQAAQMIGQIMLLVFSVNQLTQTRLMKEIMLQQAIASGIPRLQAIAVLEQNSNWNTLKRWSILHRIAALLTKQATLEGKITADTAAQATNTGITAANRLKSASGGAMMPSMGGGKMAGLAGLGGMAAMMVGMSGAAGESSEAFTTLGMALTLASMGMMAYQLATGLGVAVTTAMAVITAILGGAMAFLTGAVASATTAIYAFWASLGPIGWLVLALIAIVTLIVVFKDQLWDLVSGAGTFFGNLWDDIKNGAFGAVKTIADWFGWLGKQLTAWGKTASEVLVGMWNWLGAGFATIWTWLTGLWDEFWVAAGDVLGAVWTFLEDGWNSAWEVITQAWDDFWGGIGNFFGGIWDGLVAAWNGFWSWLVGGWNSFWSGVGSFLGSVWDGMVAAWNFFWTTLESLWNTFWSTLKSSWDSFWSSAGDLAGAVWETLTNIWNTFWAKLDSDWNSFWSTASNVLDGIWNFLVDVWNNFWDGLESKWNNFWGSVGNIIDNIWTGLESSWDNFWGGLTGAWDKFWADAANVLENIWNGITGGIQDIKDSLGMGDWDWPSFAKGGVMPKTGPAFLHAGEMILPPDISRSLMGMNSGGVVPSSPMTLFPSNSEGSGGGNTVNNISISDVNVANSYDVHSMMDEIEDRLRNRSLSI